MVSANKSICSAIARVNWRAKLPENVFNGAPNAIFFLDSDTAFTAGLLERLVEINGAIYANEALVSVGFRIQSKSDVEIRPTAVYRLNRDIEGSASESISSVRRAVLESSVYLMDTVKVVTNESADWVLYDDGLEAISVLAIFSSEVARFTAWERLSDFYFTMDDIARDRQSRTGLFSLFEPEFLLALGSNYRIKRDGGN